MIFDKYIDIRITTYDDILPQFFWRIIKHSVLKFKNSKASKDSILPAEMYLITRKYFQESLPLIF